MIKPIEAADAQSIAHLPAVRFSGRRFVFEYLEMKKNKIKKAERDWKMRQGFALANKMQWQRLIESPELIQAAQNFRSCYNLPLPETKNLIQRSGDYRNWMGAYKPLVVKDKNGKSVLAEHLIRFERFSRDKEKLEAQFNIPKKFQFNFHSWLCWGDSCLLGFSPGPGTPPLPKPYANNPKKDDWRPVLEWELRHPDISRDKIGSMLNLSRSTVNRHLKEIELETEGFDTKGELS
jgi:hypothetical protein